MFLVLATALLVPAVIVWRATHSPEIQFVGADPDVPWITFPVPLATNIQRSEPLLEQVFRKRFVAADAPHETEAVWTIRWQGMKETRATLNGHEIGRTEGAWSPQSSWRQWVEVDVSRYVQAGTNHLEVRVRNPSGPALLRASIVSPTGTVVSDSSWPVQQRLGDLATPWTAATLASDTEPYLDAAALPTTRMVAARTAPRLISVFLLLFIVFYLGQKHLSSQLFVSAARWSPTIVAGVWGVFLCTSFWELPIPSGFDGLNHFEYFHLVVSGNWAPLAGESFSSYHPPLFYWVTAVLYLMLGVVSTAKVVKLVAFASGLCHVVVAGLLTRKFYPDHPLAFLVATLFAGFLPMNLYMSAYFSNEPFAGALIGLSLFSVVLLLVAPTVSWWRTACLGLLLGLALLAKFTILAVLPWIFLFLTYRFRKLEGLPWRVVAARLALLCTLMAVVAGWFYARNMAHFGQPLVFNWELERADGGWWQAPGFHTPSYYLGFGASISEPFFSGFQSFGDALYSTVWGDGYLGGRTSARFRHPLWNYDYMTACFPLAVPMSLLMLVGGVRLTLRILRDPDPGWRLASGFTVCTLLVFLYGAVDYSLKAPMYSTVKAFFALGLVPVLALLVASGWSLVSQAFDGSARLLWRSLLNAYGGTLVVAVILAFVG